MINSLLHRYPLYDQEDPTVAHVVVEIPKNGRVKYEYDEEHDAVKVDRVFRTPVNYPQNYGFFPKTWNRFDNDPMDGIIVSSEEFVPGCVVPVRIVGMIEMEDDGEIDHKIVSVPTGHSDYAHCQDLEDLDQEIIENLIWFLSRYKDRENKVISILGTKGAAEAQEFLQDCEKTYQEKFPS